MLGPYQKLYRRASWLFSLLAAVLLVGSTPRPTLAVAAPLLPPTPAHEESPPIEEESDEQEKERGESSAGELKATRHRSRFGLPSRQTRLIPCRLTGVGAVSAHSRTAPPHAATPFQRGVLLPLRC